VTFDLDLDLEHILDARWPGVHRVQVWWRSDHLRGRRSDLRKSLQTDRRRMPRHCISSFLEWANNKNNNNTLIYIAPYAELHDCWWNQHISSQCEEIWDVQPEDKSLLLVPKCAQIHSTYSTQFILLQKICTTSSCKCWHNKNCVHIEMKELSISIHAYR